MTIKEIISGLVDLKSDAESHREADGTIADVFQNDIDVLDAAIEVLTSLQTVDNGRGITMIKDKIDKVVKNYYNETDECYNSLRYDNNENDFYMKDEIENLLKEAEVDFKIEIESGFSNCAYDSEFIAVAWIEEGKLNMRTILTEDY